MGPKLLGGGASLIAALFILALPSIFKGEPADEVEPIRFGPLPELGLSTAMEATVNDEPAPFEPRLPSPTAVPQTPASTVASTPDGGEGATSRGSNDAPVDHAASEQNGGAPQGGVPSGIQTSESTAGDTGGSEESPVESEDDWDDDDGEEEDEDDALDPDQDDDGDEGEDDD